MKKALLLIVFVVSSVASFAQQSNCVHRKHRRITKRVVTTNVAKENHTLACHCKITKRKKLMARADGVVTRKERARLKYRQAKFSTSTYLRKNKSFNNI